MNLHFNYITFDGGINFIGATDRRNSDIFDGTGARPAIARATHHDNAPVMVHRNRSKRIWHELIVRQDDPSKNYCRVYANEGEATVYVRTYVRTYLRTWMLGDREEERVEEGEIRATNVTRRQSPTREE